ncbi:MAG: zinc-binding dehydrogenase, partial [Salinisphaera sp.]|nr:zinc-binding dehydrogenase [Salinisphaera sp.]
FQEGELVIGFWGWQDYALSDGSRLRKLSVEAELAHPSYALGVLGRSSGFAAYIAVEELIQPKAGETLVLGTATGALSQVAAQIAKLRGCRIVGASGSDERCRFAVSELGYDSCIPRGAKDLPHQLAAASPNGVDGYVETVGGVLLDAVLPLFNLNARLAVCGLMSMYTAAALPSGPDRTMVFLNQVIFKRLHVQGLVGNDYYRSHFASFQRAMSDWIQAGQVKPLEDVVESLEDAPRALQGIFEGRNLGKVVVRVGEEH